jgi:deoxyribonuclease V
MKGSLAHPWDMSTRQACEVQRKLAQSVIKYNDNFSPRTVAGIDVSVARFSRAGRAAVAVLSYPALDLIDLAVAEGDLSFPYVPGLLSFREAPLVIQAWKRLQILPDVIIVDGQGIAHPRRLGIASHLGLLLDVPAIGCAKSRLIGDHQPLSPEAGSHCQLTDEGEIIGAALRTRNSTRPLYVSIGHRIDLPTAISLVLSCCRGLRLPEPTRLAHHAAGKTLNHCLRTSRRLPNTVH